MPSILRPLAFLSLAFGALSTPLVDTSSPKVCARAMCNDNLGRCFRPTGTKTGDIASRAAATAFCSSFLSIPIVTSIVGTSTPTTGITVTTTLTASTEIQTSVIISNVQATESTQTTTTTTLSLPMTFTKRSVETIVPPPKCAPGTASPAQFTSACACLNVVPSTTYITRIAPLSTTIVLQTSSITITSTALATSTVTTGTTTQVSTQIVIETPGPPPPSPPAPMCEDAANPYLLDGESYTVYCNKYSPSGDLISDPITGALSTHNVATFSGCIDVCAATPECIYGFWVGPNAPPQYSGDIFSCYKYRSNELSQFLHYPGMSSFLLNE